MTWPCLPLKSLCTLGPEYGANAPAVERSVGDVRPRYVRITDIDEDGYLRRDGAVSADISDDEGYLLQPGDILFARSGNTVGKTYMHREENGPCIFAGYLLRFRPDREKLRSEFLSYYTRSPEYRRWITSRQRVAGQPNINGTEYSGLGIPVPHPREQDRLLEILRQADELKRASLEHRKRSNRILGAMFSTWKSNSETRELATLCSTPPEYGDGAKAIEFTPERPRYVRITDIDEDGTLNAGEKRSPADTEFTDYLLAEGDLVFARSGATVGKTYLYDKSDGPCTFAGYLIRFRIDPAQADPAWVFAFTQTTEYWDWVRCHMRAAAQPNINAKEYSRLLVPTPQDETAASRFVEAARKLGPIRRSHKKVSADVEALFQILLTRAFDGRLTAKWREAHARELCQEIAHQHRAAASATRTALREFRP